MPEVQVHRLIYRALEPRMVFDGAGVATADIALEQSAPADVEQATNEAGSSHAENTALYKALAEGSSDQTYTSGDWQGQDPASNEFVFIDSSVENVDALIAGINPSAQIVMLDGDRNGVEQIVDALQGASGVTAIHILSHGDNGELSLGNAIIDVEGLRQDYADDFAAIGSSLSDQADILIYGCYFSAGETGSEAVELLGQMTGADIAASNNLTGSASQGGDWQLETHHGVIETQTISVSGWSGVLDLPPVANNDTVTATEDERTIFNPLSNDSDAEGDVFLTSFGQPGSGEVSIAMGETGSIDVDSGGTTITLDRNYENPIVFVFTTTENESSSSPDIARVSNITGNSFDLAIVEPNSGNAADLTDGAHGLESVSYIVLESGVWTLGDGTVVEVGTRDVSTDANSFTNVTFNHTFSSAPVVLSQVQSNNNAVDYNEARQRNVSGTGYQVTNEPADYQSSAIGVAESIGFLAISSGTGNWSGIDFEAGLTADSVTHTDQSISFANDLGPSVNFLAQLHTFDGPDNAHADAKNLTGSGVSVSVQEDRTSDSEVNHTTERVGWLALGGDGLLGAISGTNLRMASADVQFIYTTADDVFGSESFSYTVEDTIGQTASATVTINSVSETDTVADSTTTIDSNPVTLNVLDNDNFEGSVTLTGISAPANGTVSFNASGSVTYTPNAGFQGVETLTYTVTEDTLGLAETGSISITVTSNTAPSANTDNVAATEDATTTFNPLANDTDAESDFFLTSFAHPAVGDLQLDIGQVGSIDVDSTGTTINFGRSYTNPVVFAFVTTENETSSDPDIVRVSNVTGTSFDLRIVEPNSGVGSDTTDGVHGNETVSYVVLEAGVWTLADGTVVEVGKNDVSTGANGFTNVNFKHNFGGTPVVISSVQTDNNGIPFNSARQDNVSATGYQVTNEPADYQSNAITQAESIGYLVIGQGSGTWSGLNFEAGVTADNITHTDRAVSFSNALGGAPNLLAQLHTFDGGDNAHLDANGLTGSGVNFSVQEDRTSDSEINHTTERAGWLAIGGSGVLGAVSGTDYRIASSDVQFSYTPPDDVNGVQTFNYTVEDVHGNTATGQTNLNIAPEVDTVVDVVTTTEETAVSFNVLTNDVFEGAVTLSNVLTPANGSVTFDAAGNVTYTPNPDFFGVETITYVVTEDTLGVTETGTIKVTVTNVNDAPVANDDLVVTDAGRPTSIFVVANDSDVDLDTLSVVSANAANGSVSIAADGKITYQSAPGFVGQDTITYKISDGNGGTADAIVTVEVRPVSHIAIEPTERTVPAPQVSFRETMHEDGAVLDALKEISGNSQLSEFSWGSKSVQFATELENDDVSAILKQSEIAGLDLIGVADTTLAKGYSLQFSVMAGDGNTLAHAKVILDTVLLGETMILSVSIQSDLSSDWISGIRIVDDVDGNVPQWLTLFHSNSYVGQLPSDMEGQQLRLVIEHSDGSVIHQTVHVAFSTGMTHISESGVAPITPAPFQAQFKPTEVIAETTAGQLGTLIKKSE